MEGIAGVTSKGLRGSDGRETVSVQVRQRAKRTADSHEEV